MILLQNEYAMASIREKGAELQSLILKNNERQYMWNGDASYWGKFSPVLFPIVGALKENSYAYNESWYHLSRHGFARDRNFKVVQKNDTEASFTLSSDPETLKIYPFSFELHLHYKLQGSVLSCTYEVTNPALKPLLFSIGAHPAFALPVDENLSYEDYYLEFHSDMELICHKIDHDLISDETNTLKLENNQLPLSHKLFYEDALVIKGLKSNRISLRCLKNSGGLHFDFDGFPFFGIWAAKDANFICLEPWCGIADSVHHNQQLTDKEGIQSLAPGQSWQRTWSATLF